MPWSRGRRAERDEGSQWSSEWNKSVWESTLAVGLRTLHLAVDTHPITSHFAIPLLIQARARSRAKPYSRG